MRAVRFIISIRSPPRLNPNATFFEQTLNKGELLPVNLPSTWNLESLTPITARSGVVVPSDMTPNEQFKSLARAGENSFCWNRTRVAKAKNVMNRKCFKKDITME